MRLPFDENCSVALRLTAGHVHDGGQFESLYESLDADNVLELMIDSTHRFGRSDVAYELFEVLPRLQRGVFVAIHDLPIRVQRRLGVEQELLVE